MTNETDNTPLTRPSIKRFGAATLGLLSDHVELLGVELQEQKMHGMRALVWTGMALFNGLLLMMGLSVLLLVLLWDSYRLQAIVGLCTFYASALLLSLWRLHVALKRTSLPFSATRAELNRSREQLLP